MNTTTNVPTGQQREVPQRIRDFIAARRSIRLDYSHLLHRHLKVARIEQKELAHIEKNSETEGGAVNNHELQHLVIGLNLFHASEVLTTKESETAFDNAMHHIGQVYNVMLRRKPKN